MPDVPPRRLALLGGGFSTEDDGLLDDWLLGQARTPRPKVCFLPTASGDALAYTERFLTAFRTRPSCAPSGADRLLWEAYERYPPGGPICCSWRGSPRRGPRRGSVSRSVAAGTRSVFEGSSAS